MTRKIIIDPITRLEGHGKITIFLDSEGNVTKAYLQIPELRAFEKILIGRPAEDAPQITSRICGVCSTAHHMAATKALDDLYRVVPPSPALKIRELVYNMFMLEDHALHVYVLAGPDFLVGPKGSKAERNVLGVIKKIGTETGLRVIKARKIIRKMMERIAGKATHPVFGLPGGIAKPLDDRTLRDLKEMAKTALDLATFTYRVFKKMVLKNEEYVNLLSDKTFSHRTYYMGLVDSRNRVNFYDGMLRIVDPRGNEYAKFHVREYIKYLAEHVEPWTYVRFTYLRGVGWKGFIDGEDSGIFAVGPLARLNVADGMATPMAQEAYEEMYEVMGGKPVHNTLAYHWARVIEMLYAAERIKEIVEDPDIASKYVREMPAEAPSVGIGVVEAPRGVLIHHYETSERGIIKKANLLVATQHNAARIALSIDKAARKFIKGVEVDEGLLNMVEMFFRAYDPCHGCATHVAPGSMPLILCFYDDNGNLLRKVRLGPKT